METTTTTPTPTTPLRQALDLLTRNINLDVELLVGNESFEDEEVVLVDRIAGFAKAAYTEDAVWETLTPELCDLLEAERMGGGTIVLREFRS